MVDGWKKKKIEEISFHIRYEPKVSNTYKEWLKKSLARALIPRPNIPTRIIDMES